MDEPWWTVDTNPPPDRLLLAVEHHITLRTSPDDLARRRARRWLRANDLTPLTDCD
ncbi:hypothetical protein [Actinokineospora globicatena]|uniref:Uncharacterized protein n=1 Tax=Actinokineospora globicatena TaxID=103729 RepID=A0A9W6QMR5_9PSEU|nr:hypothetical protein [Actinokineospora globicatena]MCP2300358.1 hypothetical protein [Actinokineospora globicatena]GLW80886.1 hypothetical protein Aglo01_53670 [Actinokineospora globicatena]GLW88079.1 hypothetical protein Aglo02_57180 [Actinokineospora globicatena]GLW92565.1 hypothetical protein Aglo03_33810 [Actinokineospora globicatena]